LGTIADLAPLTGVNRRWVKRGLQYLPKSKLPGVEALIQIAGLQSQEAGQKTANPKSLKPEDIGFRLGPRINAVGRIGDPQVIIDLLTTDDLAIALNKAVQCEQINIKRQQLCAQIEQEAIAVVEDLYIESLPTQRVLLVVQDNWHHGVIGIVASRLVERYGVPVFIGTYEAAGIIRGSARGIPEFNVFAALEYCRDLLGKFGGHRAAGGFSFNAANLQAVRSRLSEFACQCLAVEHLKPLLKIDSQIHFPQINHELYQDLNVLHPCGIDNPDPIFWTPNVQVVEQSIVGKSHIKMTLAQIIDNRKYQVKAIAWRWSDYFPIPSPIDIAYKLRENNFNGNTSIEIELLGARIAQQAASWRK
jgi:single-stranded-DNA-specific exonuclease